MSKLHSFFNDSTFSASSLQDERPKRPHSLIWFAINDFRGESVCESWERPDFLVLGNNTIQLKKEHKYYYQATALMGVCGIRKCYFLVWSLRGLHIELIEFDPGFWPNVLLKLELFFKSYMAKVMLGLHVIYFMVAQRYHSKICTILRRKNKKKKRNKK